MKSTIVLAIVLGLFVAGCEKSGANYSLRFLSRSGAELATGTLVLQGPLPTSGTTRIRYRLQLRQGDRSDKATDWFYRLFEGKANGEALWSIDPSKPGEPLYEFNFMPGIADANITATAQPSGNDKAQGTWTYEVMAGGWDGGAFEIQRQ